MKRIHFQGWSSGAWVEPCRLLVQPQPQVWRSIHCEKEVRLPFLDFHGSLAYFCIIFAGQWHSPPIASGGGRVTQGVKSSTNMFLWILSDLRGIHAWGFRWPKGERGSHAVVGVANTEQVWLVLKRNLIHKIQALHCVGYRSLVGSGVHSWGWDLGRASAYHGGEGMHLSISDWCKLLQFVCLGRPYPRPNFSVPDTFTMVLDLEAGSLAFKVDNTYLGPAFSGLKGPLYPVISTVWGNSEVSLVYRGGLEPEPLSLQQLAREEINQALDGWVRILLRLSIIDNMVMIIDYW